MCFNRYVGEIISEEEAEMRQNDAYLFSLDDKVSISNTFKLLSSAGYSVSLKCVNLPGKKILWKNVCNNWII